VSLDVQHSGHHTQTSAYQPAGNKTKLLKKLFMSIRNPEGHGHIALDKMNNNFTGYVTHWCEFKIASPLAVIPVHLLLGKARMCNNITLYQENKLQGHQREDSRKSSHDCCDHGRAECLYIITCELQSLTHIRILDNRIYWDPKLHRCKFLSYRMTVRPQT